MSIKVLSVDPGASGGLAWVESDGVTQCAPMPETEGDLMAFIRSRSIGSVTAFVEEVGGYTGGPGAPGSAMFNFGRNYGFILGCLMSHSFRIELVKPQKWQKALSLGTVKGAGGKTPWKNRLKQKAQQLFPHTDGITLKTADALLILNYAISQNKP